MKLTFFLGGLTGGGAERVVCNLANYLVSRNNEVDIITIGDDGSFGLDERIKRITLLLKEERKNAIVNSSIRLIRLLRYLCKRKRDVFVVMLPVSILLLLRLRFFVRGKVIASERSFPTNYSSRTQKQLQKLAHKADAWVFQTESSRQWYFDSLKGTDSTIIPNPINDAFVKPIYMGERKKQIITAGRLNKVKNHILLLRAFSCIYREYPDYSLIIYGDGPLKNELITEAKHLCIKENVLFPGFADWGNMSKDASMFVLSSNLEGMPNALMEAMALGLPCISTDCDGGGAAFLIESEKNGLLVPKDDVEALAFAMRRMIIDRQFAEQCGKNAHEICNRLSPDRIYSQWELFIHQVSIK